MAVQTTSTYQATTHQLSPRNSLHFHRAQLWRQDQEIAEASVRNIHLNSGSLPPPPHAKMSTIAAATVSEHPSEHSATWFYGVPLAARGSKLTHRSELLPRLGVEALPPSKGSYSPEVTPRHMRVSRGADWLLACQTQEGKKKKNAGKRIFLFPLGISGGNSGSLR